MVVIIVFSISIMVSVIMFVFVATLDLGYLVNFSSIQPHPFARRTVVDKSLVPFH